MKRYPLAGPSITDAEIALVTEAASDGWYENAGKYQKIFEDEFAEYLGVNFAIALPSCTAAIHLALLALGVGPGDEVIVPELTWIATAAPINYVGAAPVFADVDRESLCISVESVKSCISSKTKAVIAVDLYGNMPNYERLNALCKSCNISLIEDAAEAIGSAVPLGKAGTIGQIGVFSFHGSKTLTTGEGGMLVTDSSEFAARVRFLCDHGRSPGDTSFQNEEVAYKYKMSNVQAAMGIGQLRRIDQLVEKKREIFSNYKQFLSICSGTRLLEETGGVYSSYWMTTLLWEEHSRTNKFEVIKQLAEKGIDSRPIFSPLSSLQAYADVEKPDNQTSYSVGPYGVNLPSALCLSRSDIKFISDKVLEIFP